MKAARSAGVHLRRGQPDQDDRRHADADRQPTRTRGTRRQRGRVEHPARLGPGHDRGRHDRGRRGGPATAGRHHGDRRGPDVARPGQRRAIPGATAQHQRQQSWTGPISVDLLGPTSGVDGGTTRIASDAGQLTISGNITNASGGAGHRPSSACRGTARARSAATSAAARPACRLFQERERQRHLDPQRHEHLSGLHGDLRHQARRPGRRRSPTPAWWPCAVGLRAGTRLLRDHRLADRVNSVDAAINLNANTLTVGADNTTPSNPWATA